MLDERLAARPRAQRALAQLAGRPLNFDPTELEGAGPQTGWHVDDYRQPLPAEVPGEPLPEASFEIAQRLMCDYAFAERAARVWGWSYGTLVGHLERGQMDFAVRKRLDDGAVDFRIHVVSRPAREGNPLVRLGFRLVGRREQVRFARRACERMAELVEQELRDERPTRLTENDTEAVR